MKIKQSDYDSLKRELAAIQLEKIVAHRAFLLSDKCANKPKDLMMRLRWDALHSLRMGNWMSENLYTYLNDEHIDTALKQIACELWPDTFNAATMGK
jgi:hypothetical protein